MMEKAKVETFGKIFDIKREKKVKSMCNVEVKGYKITTIRFPAEMYKRLCEIASIEEVPVSVIIRRALTEYFKQYEE